MIITPLNIFRDERVGFYDNCMELAAILFHSNIEINGGLLSIFGKYWQLSAICSVLISDNTETESLYHLVN